MTKLTDSQLIVLSRAAQRDDGAATPPANLKGGALAKVAQSLMDRGLMRQIRARPGAPVWRGDEEGQSLSLAITRAGRKAIAVDGEPANQPTAPRQIEVANRTPTIADAQIVEGNASGNSAIGFFSDSPAEAKRRVASTPARPRAGTKQALLIEMLSQAEGAGIDEMIAATSWLPHTTRAALTGLRKRGFGIERSRAPDGKTTYRIVSVKGVRQSQDPEGSGATFVGAA